MKNVLTVACVAARWPPAGGGEEEEEEEEGVGVDVLRARGTRGEVV